MPRRHSVTYGTSLHKGTGAVAIGVNKMNISPMSIQFTWPMAGHLSSTQIRAEIYDLPWLSLPSSNMMPHMCEKTPTGKENGYINNRCCPSNDVN